MRNVINLVGVSMDVGIEAWCIVKYLNGKLAGLRITHEEAIVNRGGAISRMLINDGYDKMDNGYELMFNEIASRIEFTDGCYKLVE